jgi:uncharacterized membrane protein
MKNSNLIIIGALAALAAYLMFSKKTPAAPSVASTAGLLSTLANQQVTLANGNVLDTGNGVVYDPLTGNYTNTMTGQILYQGTLA